MARSTYSTSVFRYYLVCLSPPLRVPLPDSRSGHPLVVSHSKPVTRPCFALVPVWPIRAHVSMRNLIDGVRPTATFAGPDSGECVLPSLSPLWAPGLPLFPPFHSEFHLRVISNVAVLQQPCNGFTYISTLVLSMPPCTKLSMAFSPRS